MCAKSAFVAVVTCWGFLSADAAEPTPKLAVDGARAKQFVAELSTDAMQGRMSGTEGYRQAADWVAAQFASWGLKPAGQDGTWFQEVRMGQFEHGHADAAGGGSRVLVG
jgi:hypothetical protein